MSRATRSKPRARGRPEPRRARSPFRGPLVFLVGLVLLVVAGWIEGPAVVRQVYALVGVRRVEAHAAVLREAARESGVDVHLLAGLAYVESRGRVDALSSAGAMGLFQLMPAAASDAAKRLRLPEPTASELLSDARLSARSGANHLRQLQRTLGADPERVLVAYNAGRARLLGWEREAGGWAAWRERHAQSGDSPTLAYAQDVLRIAERFRGRGVLAAGDAPAAPSSARPQRSLDGGPAEAVPGPPDGGAGPEPPDGVVPVDAAPAGGAPAGGGRGVPEPPERARPPAETGRADGGARKDLRTPEAARADLASASTLERRTPEERVFRRAFERGR